MFAYLVKPFKPSDLLIPVAIVLAGFILATAIYVFRIDHTIKTGGAHPETVRAVTLNDHIIGNPGAPVTIIEYGDIDSSYSKSFQLTMEQLMTEYADGGKVAWVYRHFPLTVDHPNSATNALAAECAASLSTPITFFHFIDAMQAAAPGENQFIPTDSTRLLGQFGIDEAKFKSCMTTASFMNHIHEDYDNALSAGATASPFVILLIHGQKPLPINGALPYTSMKKIIEDSIAKSGS